MGIGRTRRESWAERPVDQLEFLAWGACQKAFDDVFVFFPEHTAGRIDDESASLDVVRCCLQHAEALCRQSGHCLRCQTPTDLGMASQGAGARAGCVDECAGEVTRELAAGYERFEVDGITGDCCDCCECCECCEC